jgi:hypothetical protein
MEFRISLTPRLSIFLMLFSLIFLVLISLIGYELGYREGERNAVPSTPKNRAADQQSSDVVGPRMDDPSQTSTAAGMRKS